MITSTNLNIVLTNALCYTSTQAVKVSKLLSIDNSCADSEVLKLKLVHDYIDTLKKYNLDLPDEQNCLSLDEFNIILNKLMDSVGICECQLIQ